MHLQAFHLNPLSSRCSATGKARVRQPRKVERMREPNTSFTYLRYLQSYILGGAQVNSSATLVLSV